MIQSMGINISLQCSSFYLRLTFTCITAVSSSQFVCLFVFSQVVLKLYAMFPHKQQKKKKKYEVLNYIQINNRQLKNHFAIVFVWFGFPFL